VQNALNRPFSNTPDDQSDANSTASLLFAGGQLRAGLWAEAQREAARKLGFIVAASQRQVGPAQVDIRQIGTNQIGIGQVGTDQNGPLHAGVTQINLGQIGFGQVGLAQVGSHQAAALNLHLVQICTRHLQSATTPPGPIRHSAIRRPMRFTNHRR
jgi:hypothetical protein